MAVRVCVSRFLSVDPIGTMIRQVLGTHTHSNTLTHPHTPVHTHTHTQTQTHIPPHGYSLTAHSNLSLSLSYSSPLELLPQSYVKDAPDFILLGAL